MKKPAKKIPMVPQAGVHYGDKIILAVKPYSDHPADVLLHIVLAYVPTGGCGVPEYVTWVYDSEDHGFSIGHYFRDDILGATQDFVTRGVTLPKKEPHLVLVRCGHAYTVPNKPEAIKAAKEALVEDIENGEKNGSTWDDLEVVPDDGTLREEDIPSWLDEDEEEADEKTP